MRRSQRDVHFWRHIEVGVAPTRQELDDQEPAVCFIVNPADDGGRHDGSGSHALAH